ncbi:hypothetical protein B4U80_13804, partial [Leptotrombidium deliense]
KAGIFPYNFDPLDYCKIGKCPIVENTEYTISVVQSIPSIAPPVKAIVTAKLDSNNGMLWCGECKVQVVQQKLSVIMLKLVEMIF